jgi:septal ring factor EnvC (AmiA/AmiB activator)
MTPEAWEGMKHAGWVTLRHVASAVLIVAVLWAVARPHAQEFITETVADRLEKVERQMDTVQRSINEQQRAQDVLQTDIGHVKEGQKDQRRDTRMILQSLQGLRRDLRAE